VDEASSRWVDLRTSLIFASNDEVDVAASRLATSLSVAFSLHESSFRGGEYLMAEAGGGEQVIVQRNRDDDEPAEDVDAPTIVYVDGTPRPSEVLAAANEAGLVLHRREGWPAP
jgi:hypothetical protein